MKNLSEARDLVLKALEGIECNGEVIFNRYLKHPLMELIEKANLFDSMAVKRDVDKGFSAPPFMLAKEAREIVNMADINEFVHPVLDRVRASAVKGRTRLQLSEADVPKNRWKDFYLRMYDLGYKFNDEGHKADVCVEKVIISW